MKAPSDRWRVEAMDLSPQRSHDRATLEVRASHTAARRLYERAGFTVTRVRHAYSVDPPDDALVHWGEATGSLETPLSL